MPLKIKICGVTNVEDARLSAELGADALGFNFYEKSPRYISPEKAREIIEKLPREIIKVGVFVNPTVREVQSLDTLLDLIQLHGQESPEFVSRLGDGRKIIKAMSVGDGFDGRKALDYLVGGFLLDAESRDIGGSGKRFDWDIAVGFKEFVPEFYLAGGLDPENIAEAISRVRPFGVDVCSGVESAKRIKDRGKLEAFIRNARAAL